MCWWWVAVGDEVKEDESDSRWAGTGNRLDKERGHGIDVELS